MLSDDREPNRDLETFGDAMTAMNGGDSMIRYRTKISPGYTLDLDLLSPSVVEGVSILVHADQGQIATGYSGIAISVSNDSGSAAPATLPISQLDEAQNTLVEKIRWQHTIPVFTILV